MASSSEADLPGGPRGGREPCAQGPCAPALAAATSPAQETPFPFLQSGPQAARAPP